MSPREQLTALAAFFRHEIGRFIRLWQQTLVPPMITTALYFMIFGNVIGRRIGEMNGVNYIDFILPGLLAMSVINSAYANSSFSLFSMKFQRSIEEMLVSPMPAYNILAGFILASLARSLLVGLLVLLVAAFFVDLNPVYPVAMIGAMLLSSCFFAFAGFLNAIYADTFDEINVVPNFVLTPLIYLGGVFYSVQLLPAPWDSFARLNPIFYLVDMQRYAMLGASDTDILWTLIFVCMFTLAAGALCLRVLVRGVGLQE